MRQQRGGFRDPLAARRAGLVANPFAHVDHEALAAHLPPPPWVLHWATERWRCGVIVGPEGSGKTTAAAMLVRQLAARGEGPIAWHTLAPGDTAWPGVDGGARILVLDDAQRLGRRARARLPKQLAAWERVLLVGLEDVAGAAESTSLAVVRRHQEALDASALAGYFEVRVAASWRDPLRAAPSLEPAAAEAVLAASRGNARAAQRVLYWVFEALIDAGSAARLTAEALELGVAAAAEEGEV